MQMVNNIHDALFRETMSHRDVAADFLRQYLPEPDIRHVRLETHAIRKFMKRKIALMDNLLTVRVRVTPLLDAAETTVDQASSTQGNPGR